MKFVRFSRGEEPAAYGILEGPSVHRITGSIYDRFEKTGDRYDLSEVRLLVPCEPSKILLIGINYKEHIAEIGKKVPAVPSLFMKPLTTLINPLENIVYPEVARQVDYEGEMAIVIKHKIRNVPEEEARSHVLGVTPFNDVTERIMGYDQELLTYCKGFDTFASFGPVIDTDIDPDDTVVRTFLNGEKVQEGFTKEMVFDCSKIVSYVSRCMTLFPGDIISTGTPVHVLPMKDGDRVEIEIEGIPERLVNFVYDPKAH